MGKKSHTLVKSGQASARPATSSSSGGSYTTTPPTFPCIPPRSSDYKDQARTEVLLADQIILIHTFIPPTTCARFLSFFTSTIAPLLTRAPAARKGEAVRTSDRYSVTHPLFAEDLYRLTGLHDLVRALGIDVLNGTGVGTTSQQVSRKAKVVVGLNSNVRVYRYPPTTFFGPHYDDAVTDTVTGATSAWTLLVYFFEGEVRGGETSFDVGRGATLAPPLENGMALLHRHGHDCLLHEGLPIRAGVKWVLRTDLMYAPA